MPLPVADTSVFCSRSRGQLPDKARFCNSCGTPIGAIVADKGSVAEQGERLIATGRFCDLSGYIALN